MDLKPANKATAPHRVRYDGREGAAPAANPWEVVASPKMFGADGRRRRWSADTKGATPPRDGPFAPAAGTVAKEMPPQTRRRRT
jgi:hypothetical protein